MSQRTTTVFTCDMCGNDIADPRKKASFLLRGDGGNADVGPCCADRSIAELAAVINKRSTPREKPGKATARAGLATRARAGDLRHPQLYETNGDQR